MTVGNKDQAFRHAKTPEQLRAELEPPEEILALRKNVKDLRGKMTQMRSEYGRVKELIQEAAYEMPVHKAADRYYTPPKGGRKVESPCMVVQHRTDDHYGAVQLPEEIEFFGNYSPDIFKERIFGTLVPKFVDWIENKRKSYIIDECVIIATGDMISGDIQRLYVTNAFPSPVQAVQAGHYFGEYVANLSPHFKKIRVEWICADNHGRLTTLPQSREEGYNSWNYVVGEFAKSSLRDHDNVEFNIYPMYQKVIDVVGWKYLSMHGHQIKGWAGFPYYGLERKAAREAIKRIKSRHQMYRWEDYLFDKVLIGHYHAPLNHPVYMVGGSVSGTDAYDHKDGRHAGASQTSWMVHPKHGEFDWLAFNLMEREAQDVTIQTEAA